jgi:hypothetical protein
VQFSLEPATLPSPEHSLSQPRPPAVPARPGSASMATPVQAPFFKPASPGQDLVPLPATMLGMNGIPITAMISLAYLSQPGTRSKSP